MLLQANASSLKHGKSAGQLQVLCGRDSRYDSQFTEQALFEAISGITNRPGGQAELHQQQRSLLSSTMTIRINRISTGAWGGKRTTTTSSFSSVVCVQDGTVTLNFHPDAISLQTRLKCALFSANTWLMQIIQMLSQYVHKAQQQRLNKRVLPLLKG